MAVEFFFMEPERVKCVKVNVPVVLAEEEVEIVIDNTSCLPELVMKIDHIDVRVKDVEVEPMFIHERPSREDMDFMEDNPFHMEHHHMNNERVSKIKTLVIHGTLHKQIYYVNKDNDVKHTAEDIPFTKTVHLSNKVLVMDEDQVSATFKRASANIKWELVKASRLHQTGMVHIRVKLIEEREIFVQVCPRIEPTGKCDRVNLLRDPSLEAWSDYLMPVFWGGSNLSRSTRAHSGRYAAAIGRFAPSDSGSLSQTIHRGLKRGQHFKLTFFAQEHCAEGGGHGNRFTLTANVVYYDAMGMEVDMVSKKFTSGDIPNDSYGSFSVDAGKIHEDAVAAMVCFVFEPEKNNTNTVIIDDVSFMCVS